MTSANITVERIYPDRFSIIEDVLPAITSPALLGYHTPAYMNMLTRVLHDNPLYLAAFAGGELAAFMPLRWRTGSLGPVINGLPFFGPNGGPVFTRTAHSNMECAVRALMVELLNMAEELDAVSVALYTPFLEKKFPLDDAFQPDRVVERFTQYLSLPSGSDPVRWPTRSRRAVVRAKKNECTVRVGTSDDLPTLLSIYLENCTAAAIPLKPDTYFYRVVNDLCPAGIARFTVAEHHGRIVACLVTIQGGITVSYNVPCSRKEDRALQGNSLLIDESVHHFKQLGYRYWNWESSASRQHPVYEFKSNWGSVEALYSILLRYPRGLEAFARASAQDVAEAYPFYFVIPFTDMERYP